MRRIQAALPVQVDLSGISGSEYPAGEARRSLCDRGLDPGLFIRAMKENKELYEAPTISVVEMKQEGVICTSGDVTATMNGVFSEETI